MIEKIVPLAADIAKGVQGSAAFSASERFALEMAPSGIREIRTLSGNLLKRGESMHVTDPKLGIDLTVDLMKDGRATVMPGVPGYTLQAGTVQRFGLSSNLSKFERERSMLPLEVGERTPLGVEGDWLLKSGSPSLQLDPVAGSIGGDHYLAMRLFRADDALAPRLSEIQSAMAPPVKKLSWKF